MSNTVIYKERTGTATTKESDLTWQDLENKINKWNTDIEQQVSVFIKQV